MILSALKEQKSINDLIRKCPIFSIFESMKIKLHKSKLVVGLYIFNIRFKRRCGQSLDSQGHDNKGGTISVIKRHNKMLSKSQAIILMIGFPLSTTAIFQVSHIRASITHHIHGCTISLHMLIKY